MSGKTLKFFKKKKFRRICICLLAGLVIVLLVPSLLLYRPARVGQLHVADTNEVSPYLTHQLLPQLYNGTQLAEPFDLPVAESGINDIIARCNWPRQYGQVIFSVPVVSFTAGFVELTGVVVTRGVELLVTLRLKPVLDADGLLNLYVTRVKIGAMNITPVARLVAARMYQNRLAEGDIDTEDIWARIAASLLTNQPFDPVFTIEDKKVRLDKITLAPRKLTLGLMPVPD